MKDAQVEGTKPGTGMMVLFTEFTELESTTGEKILEVSFKDDRYHYQYRTPEGAVRGSYIVATSTGYGSSQGNCTLEFYPPGTTVADKADPNYNERSTSIECLCDGELILIEPESLRFMKFMKTWQ